MVLLKIPLSVRSTPVQAAATQLSVDVRKLHDEFKKPLDDTRAILNDFGMKRHAPTLLEVAQAEAMREHLTRVSAKVGAYQTKIDALQARHPTPSKLSRPQRSKFESTLSELVRDKKRIEEQCGVLRDKFMAKRDDVLAKTSAELVRANDAYDKAYEDLVKPKGEASALERIGETVASPQRVEVPDLKKLFADLDTDNSGSVDLKACVCVFCRES